MSLLIYSFHINKRWEILLLHVEEKQGHQKAPPPPFTLAILQVFGRVAIFLLSYESDLVLCLLCRVFISHGFMRLARLAVFESLPSEGEYVVCDKVAAVLDSVVVLSSEKVRFDQREHNFWALDGFLTSAALWGWRRHVSLWYAVLT